MAENLVFYNFHSMSAINHYYTRRNSNRVTIIVDSDACSPQLPPFSIGGHRLEFKDFLRLRSEILRFKYSDEVQKSTWSQMGSLKTARFGSLALPLPNVDRFLLLGGKSNSTIGKNFEPNP